MTPNELKGFVNAIEAIEGSADFARFWVTEFQDLEGAAKSLAKVREWADNAEWWLSQAGAFAGVND